MASSRPGHTETALSAVAAFYQRRAYEPVWVDGTHVSRRTGEALVVLHNAEAHGLVGNDYGEAAIRESHDALKAGDTDAPDRIQHLAEFDTRVTRALLALGRDVALGRTDPSGIAAHWKARRTEPDLASSLLSAIETRRLEGWLDQVRPRHPEYAALQKAYADLRGQQQKGGWPTVPAGRFKPGQAHPAVVVLRQRLSASGMLDGDAAAKHSAVFDAELEHGVRAFQELHAIKATGVVDAPTLAALNVPLERRLQQVAINLERWRWMPDDLGDRHLMVNVPYFHLIAREHGKAVLDIRVVVGKPGNETPIFSDEMESVVFSPYWNIPDSIKLGETMPAAVRDAGYLERNNIEVLRGSRPVEVSTIDWSDPAQLRELHFRQRPGATNALGHVKFLFPNDFDVYLHDTPADSLFARRGRAFSHGCVRVEEPEVLAKYILRDRPEWTGARIVKAMHAGDEQHVKLDNAIPVHIVYFTAWVDEQGGLHFQPDIYGYDGQQARHSRTSSGSPGASGTD